MLVGFQTPLDGTPCDLLCFTKGGSTRKTNQLLPVGVQLSFSGQIRVTPRMGAKASSCGVQASGG